MHPHLKEARDSAGSKLKRIAGFHGTEANPSGNKSPRGTLANPGMAERPGEVIPNGPQGSVGLASIEAEGKAPRRNLGKFARGGRAKHHKGTNVNIMIGQPSGAPPIAPMGAPALPMPRPPMAGPPPGAPPGMPPPGMGPGMPPPGMGPPGIRKSGGRAFKRGGSVAPQYPQRVKTAVKQPSLRPDMKKHGGGVKKKAYGGPMMPGQMPVNPMMAGRPVMPQQMPMVARKGGKVKRAHGGRTYDAGSLTGIGRLEKIENYGRKAHDNPKKQKV
jgi:hypothetical protein